MADINFSDYGDIKKNYTKEELVNIYRQIIENIENDVFDESDTIMAVPLPFNIGDRVEDLCGDIYIVSGFTVTECGVGMDCYPEGTDKDVTEEYGLHWKNFTKI